MQVLIIYRRKTRLLPPFGIDVNGVKICDGKISPKWQQSNYLSSESGLRQCTIAVVFLHVLNCFLLVCLSFFCAGS